VRRDSATESLDRWLKLAALKEAGEAVFDGASNSIRTDTTSF
jgi:hypothetical protein